MAIQTFDDLKTAITEWIVHSKVADRVEDIITMAEFQLARDLRLAEWEQRATASTVAGEAYLQRPSSSAGIKYIKLNTDPVTVLRHESVAYIDSRYAGSETSKPLMFAISGDQIRLAPTPDSAYTVEIAYEKPPTALASGNQTNWFTDNTPDLLLFACLVEAAGYMKEEPEYLSLWKSRVTEISAIVKKRDNMIKYPEGPVLRSRVY